MRIRHIIYISATGPTIRGGMPFRSNGAYSFLIREDRRSYCIGWTTPPCDELEEIDNFTSDAWRYQGVSEVAGVLNWGFLHIYNVGGYIANLDINRDVSKLILRELWQNRWIDDATRAMFIEFAVYNANANLFSVVTLLVECPESGGVLPYVRIQTFRVYVHEGPFGFYILGCEIIFLLFLVYMIYKQVSMSNEHC